MRWRTLPVELLLLAFFAVFLLYPLVYVLPAAASDEDFAVRLLSLGESSEQKARVLTVLAKTGDLSISRAFTPPFTVKALPTSRAADNLAPLPAPAYQL